MGVGRGRKPREASDHAAGDYCPPVKNPSHEMPSEQVVLNKGSEN